MRSTKKKTRCFLSADGQTFTIKMERWANVLPVSDVDDQISFYERLRDRKNGKYAADYAPTVMALKKLKDKIGVQV